MQNLQGKTVREIALEMPITTRVFEEFKIDYCCHGNTLFDEACRNVGASPEAVMQKIDSVVEILGNENTRIPAERSFAVIGVVVSNPTAKNTRSFSSII